MERRHIALIVVFLSGGIMMVSDLMNEIIKRKNIDDKNNVVASDNSKDDIDIRHKDNKENYELTDDVITSNNKKEGVFKLEKISDEDKKSLKYYDSCWVSVPEKSYEISLIGKGEYGIEEGYGKVALKYSDDKINTISLIDEKKTQTTILKARYVKNNDIAVITGGAFGTLVNGEKLYLVDVNTGASSLIYEEKDDKTRIKDCIIDKGRIKLRLTVYKDDALNEYDEKEIYLE